VYFLDVEQNWIFKNKKNNNFISCTLFLTKLVSKNCADFHVDMPGHFLGQLAEALKADGHTLKS